MKKKPSYVITPKKFGAIVLAIALLISANLIPHIDVVAAQELSSVAPFSSSDTVPDISGIPEDSPLPESTPAPEGSPTPETSPVPESSLTPEASPAPESSPVPEISPVPEGSSTPEGSPSPEGSPQPESSPAPDQGAATPSPAPDFDGSGEKPVFPLIPDESPEPEFVPKPIPGPGIEELAASAISNGYILLTLSQNMEDFITHGKLTYSDAQGEELQPGAEIGTAAQLCISYYFDLNAEQLQAVDASDNKVYTVPLPTYLKWAGGYVNMPLKIVGYETAFAYLEYNSDTSAASITFVENIGETFSTDVITDGYFYLACTLDGNAVGDKEKVNIELTPNDIYEVTVTDNKKTDPTLEKSGVYENGRFTWTVTYTPGTKEIQGDITLSDTLDSSIHTYIPGSAKTATLIVPESFTPIADPVMSTDNNTLTFSVSDPNVGFVLQYSTRLTPSAINSGEVITAENKISLISSASNTPLASASGSVEAEGEEKSWIIKTGTYSPSDRKITWELNVSTLDQTVQSLILYDQLPQGLTLVQSSMQVDGQPLSPGFTLHTIPGQVDNKDYTFSLTFPAITQPHYKITYDTTISDDYYDTSKPQTSFSNQAWLSFDWLTGPGPGETIHMAPTVSKEVSAATDAIQKSGTYDRATHQITWSVTVNPHKVDMTGAKMTDDLSDVGQTYVPGSFSTESVNLSLTTDSPKLLVVEATSLNNKSATFTFKTTVDDPADYAYNTPKGKKYYNTVSCQSQISGHPVTCTATASVSVISQVFLKGFDKYDYSTHLITWRVEVNQNNMEMANAIIKDSLPEGLAYKADSVTVDGVSKADVELGITVEPENLLCIPLGDISALQTVTFQTQLDVSKIHSFLTDTKVTIENSASLYRDHVLNKVDSTGTAEINNQALKKTGAHNPAQSYIEYTVKINPNSIPLTTTNNRIVDTLPAGLLLDLDTVQLYTADVSANGTLTRGIQCPSGSYTVDYDAANHTLTVVLPETASPYILIYHCDVVDYSKAPFKNGISFLGDSMGQDMGDISTITVVGGGGGGLGKRKGSLTLNKTDSLDGSEPVEAATFAIFTQEGVMIDYAETDYEGKLIFPALTIGKTYTVKELIAPTGYTLMADFAVEITSDNRAVSLEINNARITGDLSFSKVNDWNRPLTGAVFRLTNKAGTIALMRNATSVDGVVSFSDIPYGQYTLVETSAPENHGLNATQYDVTVDKDGNVSMTNGTAAVTAVENVSKKASIKIAKTNKASKKPMEGVEFTVYDSTLEIRGKGKTDENGHITFTDLMIGEDYTIKETTHPGFRASTDKTVTLADENQTLVVNWENIPVPDEKGSIVIVKTDSSTGDYMPGVTFELLDSQGQSWGIAETGINGTLEFTQLQLNETYTLHETTPQGYLDSPDREVILTDEEPFILNWENTPAPQPSPSPAPTPTPDPNQGGGSHGSQDKDTNTSGGSDTSGKTTEQGKKLPQTGHNQLLPLIALGAGVLLAGTGAALMRRRKGKHEK